MAHTFVLSSCGSATDSDDNNESSYPVPSVSFECTVDANDACTSSMNGKEVRAAVFAGECSTFGSSAELLSLATVDASCDDGGCRNADSGTLLSNWRDASLPGGEYSLYIFYDADSNQAPNGEPSACIALTLPASSHPHVDTFE